MLTYASCVSWNKKGILFVGPSGSGKSDACLQIIHAGGFLVADDQTELCSNDSALIASCPASIYGKMEIRGVGILPVERVCPQTPVALVVQMTPLAEMDRMPDDKTETIQGVCLPKVCLCPFEVSFLAKLKAVLDKKVS